MLLALALAAAPCFEVADTTAGWKRLETAGEPLVVTSPPGVGQFRPDAAARVTEEDVEVVSRQGLGSKTFIFPLGEGTRAASLTFGESLRGAEVEVVAKLAGDQMKLLSRRVAGTEVSVAWERRGALSLEVTVHHHLRARPWLQRATLTREVGNVANALPLPDSLRRPSLYFEHPGGRVVVCADAAAPLAFTRPATWPEPRVVTR
ncbi:MAG: hypothetical protein Q8L48_17220 [Archangium sp.]|nr:hypothetical protein [Archangium sp.]